MSEAAIERPARREPPPAAPFFIVGTGRCGSTLLQAMLISHPRIAIPPETFFFAELDPALAFADPLPVDRIDAYVDHCQAQPHWKDLGIASDELRAALRAGTRDAAGLFGWLMARLLGDDARGRRWGEKTPRHEQHVARIAALLPDARFIHIHRDPRDVVASLLEMEWRSSGSVGLLAREVRRTHRRQQRAEAALAPERYLRLRYEDLVTAPEPTLQRVCDFLGETYDPAMLAFDRRETAGYRADEGDWKDRTRRPLDASRIGRYRRALRPEQIRRVERRLGPHLQRLGYARARAVPWQPAWWWADLRDARKRRRRT